MTLRPCVPGMVLLAAAAVASGARAQTFAYRVTAAEEASWYSINGTTPFNASNAILPQATWGNMATAGTELSAGPAAASFSVTAGADNLGAPRYASSLRELSLETSLGESLDLLVGKKILKWGTGYAFNPTGVVEPQRSPSDPTDRLNLNEGRDMVSLTAYLGKTSLTAVYLNDARIGLSSFGWGANEIALRAYTFLSGLDLTLVAHEREGDRLELGTNASYVIGDDLELHMEALGKRGTSMPYHLVLVSGDPAQLYSGFPYAPLESGSPRIFTKLLVGGQYTFAGGINVALEYYHNEEGLSVGQWKTWMNFVKFQDAVQRGIVPASPGVVAASRVNLLWSLLTLSPRGTMKDYLFTRAAYAADDWSCEVLCLMNANDQSLAAIPTLTWKPAPPVSLYLRTSLYEGRSGSEFGSLFQTAQLTCGCGVQL